MEENACRITEHFGPDRLFYFSSPGVTSSLVFKEKAYNIIKLAVYETDVDAFDNATNILQSHTECQIDEVHLDMCKYKGVINREMALNDTSTTLMAFLSKLSKDLSDLPGILIGKIITSTIKHHPTTLQVALGISMEDSNELTRLL